MICRLGCGRRAGALESRSAQDVAVSGRPTRLAGMPWDWRARKPTAIKGKDYFETTGATYNHRTFRFVGGKSAFEPGLHPIRCGDTTMLSQ